MFKEAVPTYQAALQKSGYKYERPRAKKTQRKRVIAWLNPPFNLACTVNLGREFLKLIDEPFPQNRPRKDKQEKLINRHTIKTSYNGTQSMERIISSHNAKILVESRENETCGPKELPGGCEVLDECCSYKATVTASDGDIRTYFQSLAMFLFVVLVDRYIAII